jgi:cytochrome c
MIRSALGAAALGLIALAAGCSQPASTPAPAAQTETPSTPPEAAPTSTAAEAPAATLVSLDITGADGAKMSGDPVKGKKIFAQCMTCHTAEKGVNRVGPSLYGVVGRHSGKEPGFVYSDANKNSGLTWTEQELFTYLENPQKTVPGTKMAYVGLKNPQQRADVISFLKTNAQ